MALKALLFFLALTTSLMFSRSSRSDLEGTAPVCWIVLSEIRSCSNEFVAYFANGAIDISLPCCKVVAMITHSCWFAVLGNLGFGPEQEHILRSYCDADATFGFGYSCMLCG